MKRGHLGGYLSAVKTSAPDDGGQTWRGWGGAPQGKLLNLIPTMIPLCSADFRDGFARSWKCQAAAGASGASETSARRFWGTFIQHLLWKQQAAQLRKKIILKNVVQMEIQRKVATIYIRGNRIWGWIFSRNVIQAVFAFPPFDKALMLKSIWLRNAAPV